MDTNNQWEALFTKYLQNRCSDEEFEILFSHLDESYLQNKSLDELIQLTTVETPLSQELFKNKVLRITEAVEEKLFQEIQVEKADEVFVKHRKRRFTPVYWAAAILLFCFTFSGLYLFYHRDYPAAQGVSNRDSLIAQKKAFITLSDGQAIDLESLQLGESIKDVGFLIQRNLDGAFVYLRDLSQPLKRNYNKLYNRIDIASGKQLHFILADGSNVWLNAHSSLQYPVHFSNKERFVELKGEGYFEVVKDTEKPFRVYTALHNHDRQLLEVHGTRFNVCAYESNNGIQTSLLEGSVSISLASENKVPDYTTKRMLKPMDQALVQRGNIKIGHSEIDETISWVKGFFHFNETSLESILGRLSRWYDVEFIYSKDLLDLNYSGTLPKNLPLKRVLQLLETNNKVHFVMEGRRVRVLN